MKIKDIKEWLEFFNSDDMEGLRTTLKIMDDYCVSVLGLEKPICQNNCIECWINTLNMQENKDKLENEI